MKTRITTLLLALVTSISFGQLTFVKELNYDRVIHSDLNIYEIEASNFTEGEFVIGRYASTVSAYKTKFDILKKDYSLYKTFNVDTAGSSGTQLDYVFFSDKLINTDNKIEVVYCFYALNGPERTIIADEDGNVLYELNDEYLNYYDPFTVDGKTYMTSRTGSGTIKIYEVGGQLSCPKNCSSSSSNTGSVQAPAPTYSFTLFPNPTDGPLSIETDLAEANMQIKVYSISGQLLQSGAFFTGTNQVDVSSLAAGTYVINVTSDKGFLHTEQFVKK